jgi:hypothetical protein
MNPFVSGVIRRPRPPRLSARADGVRLRCANVACGRHRPGIWLVRLDDHPLPVMVFDRAWRLIRGRPFWLCLRDRALRSKDFVAGRRPLSEYANGGQPRWRRPNFHAWWDPAPDAVVCPHCGAPQRLPPSGACQDCAIGGGHERALHDAWSGVLHLRR